MDITGACHCGNVTWKAVANPEMIAICYCTDCQSFGSSAFQYAARIKRDDFELTSGQLKAYGKLADSGNERYYSFCGDCGSGFPVTSMVWRSIREIRRLPSKSALPPAANLVLLSTRLGICESDIKLDKQG